MFARLHMLVAVVMMSVGAVMVGGCSSLPPATGPTVGIRNDSDAPLRVRFWIGDRTAQTPNQPVNMQAEDLLEIPPYGVKQYSLSVFSAYESPSASFVRVQVEPIGASFKSHTQHWFELNPPSPYTLRVVGRKPDLKFERVGPGTMVAVPPERWFYNGQNKIPATTTVAAPVGAAP